MPDVIAAVTIHNGKGAFPPGTVVTVETEEEAAALVAAGNARPIEGAQPVPASTDLPADIPRRAALEKAGLNLAQVIDLVESKGILDVDGIGPAALTELEEWLDEEIEVTDEDSKAE